MSSAKFASITAGLLARKGEARPWSAAEPADEAPAPLAFRPAVAAPPPPPPGKDKSCSLRLSPQDFERLGILAVKAGTTRQQVLKQAVAQFLAAQAKAHGCACLHNPSGACERDCGSGG